MRSTEVTRRLAAFGLDPPAAAVYYHLARMGPSPAAKVARVAGVQRSDVYRILAALEEKGFVEKTLERPTRFVPTPIEEALASAFFAKERELEELRRERLDLAHAWPRASPGLDGDSEERFAVHHGRAQIKGLLHRMVEAAREEVLVVATRRGLGRLGTMGLPDLLAAKALEGLAVRVLTEVDASNIAATGALAGQCHVRHLELPGYHQMVITDTSDAAMFVVADQLVSLSENGETVLWLRSRDFILAQKAFFDGLWAHALDHASRARELSTGELAEQAGVVRGRWMRYDRMKQMVRRARAEVRMVASGAEAARLERSGLGGLLKQRAAAGIQVRLLTGEGEAPPLPNVEVREVAMPPGRVSLDRDASEALYVFGADEAPESTVFEGEYSVWFSFAHDASQARECFLERWSEARPPRGGLGEG